MPGMLWCSATQYRWYPQPFGVPGQVDAAAQRLAGRYAGRHRAQVEHRQGNGEAGGHNQKTASTGMRRQHGPEGRSRAQTSQLERTGATVRRTLDLALDLSLGSGRMLWGPGAIARFRRRRMDLMTDLMTIGAFGERTRLSAKALRLYDRLGLVRPARTDAGSGYRFYREDQVDGARLVALLRRLGMPLPVIADVVGKPPGEAAEAIGGYWAQVESATAERRVLVSYIQARLNGGDMASYDIADPHDPRTHAGGRHPARARERGWPLLRRGVRPAAGGRTRHRRASPAARSSSTTERSATTATDRLNCAARWRPTRPIPTSRHGPSPPTRRCSSGSR